MKYFKSTKGKGESKLEICEHCGRHFDEHEEIQDSEVSRIMECPE